MISTKKKLRQPRNKAGRNKYHSLQAIFQSVVFHEPRKCLDLQERFLMFMLGWAIAVHSLSTFVIMFSLHYDNPVENQ